MRLLLPQRHSRVTKKSHFNYIFSNGKKSFGQYAIIYYAPKREEDRKVAFVTSKKVGNAVQRNKIKRIIKEIFRLNQPHIDPNYDLIFIAKWGNNKTEYKKLESDILELLRKNKLWTLHD